MGWRRVDFLRLECSQWYLQVLNMHPMSKFLILPIAIKILKMQFFLKMAIVLILARHTVIILIWILLRGSICLRSL